MVHLHMIGSYVVDFGWIDYFCDPGKHFLKKIVFDSVHKDHLLIENEVGVVRRASLCQVAMEIPEIPIPISSLVRFLQEDQ